MKKLILISTFFIALTSTNAARAGIIELEDFSESATIINWDTLPDDTAIPHKTAITDQYLPWGVKVSSLEAGSPLTVAVPSDAYSDPNLLAPPTPYSGSIVIEFVNIFSGLRTAASTVFQAGSKIDPTTDFTQVSMKAFDYNGTLLGTDTDGQGGFIGFESLTGISYVVFQGENYTIDDFIFDRASSVPEPSTLAMFSLALAGFGLRRLKKS